MNKQLLVVLGLMLALMLTGTGLHAALNGTDSGASIVNGIAGGGAEPNAAGEMSLTSANNSGVDTRWSDTTSNLSCTVVQAFDVATLDSGLVGLGLPANDTGSPGETITYAYRIINIGNGTQRMSYYHQHTGSDSTWGTTPINSYVLFQDNKLAGTMSAWDENDVHITDSAYLLLAPDNFDTILVVVRIPTTAQNGDSTTSLFTVRDSAPLLYGSGTGDGWETGASNGSLWTNDSRDTQWDTVTTYVSMAVVRIAKRIASSGHFRPGDTITYEIIYDNDGSDTAKSVAIYEALPQYTIYQVNSTQDSAPHNGNIVVYYEDGGYAGTDYTDAESTGVEKIKWACLVGVDGTDGDDIATAGNSGADRDAGYVRFTVTID